MANSRRTTPLSTKRRPRRSRPSSSSSTPRINVRELHPDDWPVIEQLFGTNGACGGCWCMWWRVPRGGKLWEEQKGSKNKRAFKRLLTDGRVHGCLAFEDDEPVGWCCVGPRGDFPRLERTKALRTDWDEGTWSVTCFYIKSAWRGQGVASALLAGAVSAARRLGARSIEGYPVRPKSTNKIPAAFAWTGVPQLFERCGFRTDADAERSRDVYTIHLERRTSK